MDLLTILVLGNYAFTAASFLFTWKVYILLHNHERTRIKNHLMGGCGHDCYYCKE